MDCYEWISLSIDCYDWIIILVELCYSGVDYNFDALCYGGMDYNFAALCYSGMDYNLLHYAIMDWIIICCVMP